MEMELLTNNNSNSENGIISFEDIIIPEQEQPKSTAKPFIQANTVEVSLQDIKDNHLIPVFVKDNSPLISHSEFIEATLKVASEVYSGETILSPSIRVSHPIKGRIPEAKSKPANQLEEWEKTLYYERLAYIIEIPTISDSINGNTLSLTIGGLKCYNHDNMYSRKGVDEHFTVFVGFQNKVCTNLCVWSDGLMKDLKVSSIGQLMGCIKSLLENYNGVFHLNNLKKLKEYSLSEQQFAHIIGRCRVYNSMPAELRKDIPPLYFGDNQIGAVVKDYYKDESFCRDANGNIGLWELYNLLTGVNKSSYIDTFIQKASNAYSFVEQLRFALDNKAQSWFLN